ncbi:hypothetical protein DV736_g3556, partial [Chaetothyriales sp. CBS 134916]
MIMGIRFLAKQGFDAYGIDDWIAIAATVTGVAQSFLIFVAITTGMGRDYNDISSSQAGTIGRLTVASYAMVIFTEFLAKSSVLFVIRRLLSANMRSQHIICSLLVRACGLWCTGSILGLIVGCGPLEQIGYHTKFCSGLVTRWEIVGILDGVSEMLVLALATFIIWPLQLPPMRKLVVLCSFIPRLFVIVLIVPHIITLSKSTHTTRLRGPSLAVPAVYLQVQMMYTIFSAAVPSLNRWLRKFDTSMGTQWQNSTYGSSRGSRGKAGTRSTGTNDNSFIMKSLNSVNKSQDQSQLRSRNSIGDPDNLRSQPTRYQANVQGHGAMDPESRSGSQASIHSQSKIIRKETRWYVDYSDE